MYQQITLVGNLGNDPQLRFFQSGTAVTNFSLAINRTWTDKDKNKHDETMWVRVSAIGEQAVACNEYLKKGQRVLVVGQLQFDPATGGPKIYPRNDNTVGASFEVRANSVQFLSTKAESEEIPY